MNNGSLIEETFAKEIKKLQLAKKKDKRNTILLGVLSVGGFLLIWYTLCATGIVDSRVLVSPLDVLETTITKLTDSRPEGSTLLANVGASFYLAIVGFCLSVVIGLPLGLLMGWYKPVDKFVRPIFEIIRPLPPIAWIPIIIVLLGIGTVAKSVIIFFTTFVPIVINAYAGIKETQKVHINFAKTCGYSNWRIFLTVGVPSAMPLSFAGMKIALGNGWSTLIAAEMLAASKGLGYMILMGRNYGRIDIIISGMLVIGIIGLMLSGVMGKIENYVLKWQVKK